MAKSRKDRWEAEAWEKLAAQRIWPVWARNLGAMIEAGVLVRFACDACRRSMTWTSRFGDPARARMEPDRAGRAVQGIEMPQARDVRGGARSRDDLPVPGRRDAALADRRPPARPRAAPGRPPPPPPPGVDAVRWAYAGVEERKRMVKEARGDTRACECPLSTRFRHSDGKRNKLMRVTCRCFLSVVPLTGCLQPEPRTLSAPDRGAPSEVDFHGAMETSLRTEVHGRPVVLGHCDRVRGLQCSRSGHASRYRCAYHYGDGRRGLAVVERQGNVLALDKWA